MRFLIICIFFFSCSDIDYTEKTNKSKRELDSLKELIIDSLKHEQVSKDNS